MKLALCDDDAADLELLAGYCRQYDPALPIHCFSSAAALLERDAQDPFDIVFLDIEMAHPNGYEAAVELSRRECPPAVIFTTQSFSYAVRGYGLALRYLPKPITYEVVPIGAGAGHTAVHPRQNQCLFRSENHHFCRLGTHIY